MSYLPGTAVRTDHALTIKILGKTVGYIQDWAPTQSRNVAPIYEINAAGVGNIYEHVPSVMGNQTITILRYDLYLSKFEDLFGVGADLTMLTNQSVPISINETWKSPPGTSRGANNLMNSLLNAAGPAFEKATSYIRPADDYEVWQYSGCWFTSLGRTHSANGDRIVKVNASMVYSKKTKVYETGTSKAINDFFDGLF
jgi:hypothetical protein